MAPPPWMQAADRPAPTKLQLSSFIPRFQLFLSVEFLCNYHAIWAEKIRAQLCARLSAAASQGALATCQLGATARASLTAARRPRHAMPIVRGGFEGTRVHNAWTLVRCHAPPALRAFWYEVPH